jgi:surface antigen
VRETVRKVLAVAAVALPIAACAQIAPGDPDLYGRLADSDVSVAARLMQTTLEQAPDGVTRRWTNDQTGSRGEITPLRTFATEDGVFCREYREELAVGGTTGRFYHTACRDEAARWVWL